MQAGIKDRQPFVGSYHSVRNRLNWSLGVLAMLLTGLMPASVHAADAPASKIQAVARFMELSGLGTAITHVPDNIKTSFGQGAKQGSKASNKLVAAINGSIDDAVNAKEIDHHIAQALADALSDDEISYLNDWYGSELGRRITAAEQQAETVEAQNEMNEKWQTLLSDSKRMDEVKKLHAVSDDVDNTLNIAQFIRLAVFINLYSLSGAGKASDIEDYQYDLVLHKPSTRARLEKSLVISHLYTYQGFSTDDLEKYQVFMSDPRWVHTNTVIYATLMTDLKSSLAKMTVLLPDVIKNNSEKI